MPVVEDDGDYASLTASEAVAAAGGLLQAQEMDDDIQQHKEETEAKIRRVTSSSASIATPQHQWACTTAEAAIDCS